MENQQQPQQQTLEYKRVINLADFLTKNSIVLSGRDKGIRVREMLRLDTEDKASDPVRILVPKDIVSLNSSFFLGLFANSVRSLGDLNFDSKYHFECTPIQRQDIEKGKKEALNKSNPLPP